MNNSGPLKNKLQSTLDKAGVIINGPNSWDPQIHDNRFYSKVIAHGSLGLGEAYMDGWFDIKEPEEFFYRIFRAELDKTINPMTIALPYLRSLLINEQNRIRGRDSIRKHYNLSPELYMSFLDKYNQYTCCYFPDGNETLEEASIKKLQLICKKLQLCPTDKVLDIGCGWGGFAKFASENYGCHVTGVSISEEQISYAREFAKGLPVEFIYADYRDIKGSYDKILICGMIEHVGYKNYRHIMQVVSKCLKSDGIFLLHTIGRNESITYGDPWIHKYIFPNAVLPSMKQLAAATEGLFVMEDCHNFGPSYYHTLMAWHKNFVNNWQQLAKAHPGYDERFYRMWTYYLLCCAAAFKARKNQLWQIVFTKKGKTGGYTSYR